MARLAQYKSSICTVFAGVALSIMLSTDEANAYDAQLLNAEELGAREFVLGACTSDAALFEVRFDLHVSPAFDHALASQDQVDLFDKDVRDAVEGDIQTQWRNVVGNMQFPLILAKEENVLRPLLDILYDHFDSRYNNQTPQDSYVIPELKTGGFQAQHPACV